MGRGNPGDVPTWAGPPRMRRGQAHMVLRRGWDGHVTYKICITRAAGSRRWGMGVHTFGATSFMGLSVVDMPGPKHQIYWYS